MHLFEKQPQPSFSFVSWLSAYPSLSIMRGKPKLLNYRGKLRSKHRGRPQIIGNDYWFQATIHHLVFSSREFVFQHLLVHSAIKIWKYYLLNKFESISHAITPLILWSFAIFILGDDNFKISVYTSESPISSIKTISDVDQTIREQLFCHWSHTYNRILGWYNFLKLP